MDRVYIVTMDDVEVGTFSTYDKAMDFIQDCWAVKPYAEYGIVVVPVDTAIVRRVYRVDFDANGNVNKSSHVSVFKNEADLNERGTGAWATFSGGVAAISLKGFDDAIARGKEYIEQKKGLLDNHIEIFQFGPGELKRAKKEVEEWFT